MIKSNELRKIARARLKDAEVLFRARRYDGASYICGYAVEIALKARICRALKWPKYPETNSEFTGYQSFRTHDLDVLLHLSGREESVKLHLLAQWFIIQKWDPSARYKPIGSAARVETQNMISAASEILRKI